ncbi:hypothetical protein [Terriglobus sp. RCC_193]|uniref:hypothetical protein n=1 Tax=Terriglobus sp. RCC_193 TaxID=3239218 RepID=UPI00352688BD
MHLWTEYEGNVIAGYPILRLLRSEGRSAFFSTTTPDGQPALLRLTESHFDESELVGRWRKISAVTHANLQAIKHSGQITFDGVPLACCLLEPIDASLADVLRDRALTLDETKEVAEAVAGALAALHDAELIHEHVDASNVYAHGEVVKLRSDCVRECIGDFEADTPESREELRKRDIRDLGLLLLRCLALEWQGSSARKLPSPMDRIIPNALDGTVTAQGVIDILNSQKPAPIAKPAPVATAAAASEAPSTVKPQAPPQVVANSPDAVLGQLANRKEPAKAAAPEPRRTQPSAAKSEDPFDVGLGSLRNEPRYQAGTESAASGMFQRLRPLMPRPISRKAYSISGALAATLAFVLWMTFHNSESTPEEAHAAVVAQAPVETQPAPQPSTASAAAPSATTSLLSSTAQAGWRVIAYTYNHEQQAQAKALQLQQKYMNLQPQVFSPTGHAPYFVALGGPLDSSSAFALRNRARQSGLPRDTYARNF